MSNAQILTAGRLAIIVTEHDGRTYYQTTVRGVTYSIVKNAHGRGWEVWSQREALRTARMGGTVRFFDDLHALGDAVKSLRGIAFAINAA